MQGLTGLCLRDFCCLCEDEHQENALVDGARHRSQCNFGSGLFKIVILTNSSCCQTLDDSLGWVTAWVKRSWGIFCKAEADDGKGAGLCDQQARPRKQKGWNWPKCLHEVGIFSPRLGDHCTKLSKTKCTWITKKVGLVRALLNLGLLEQMSTF